MACKKKQCILYFVTVRGNLNWIHENRVRCTSSSPLSTLSCLLREKSVTIGIKIEKRCVWRQVAADHCWEQILFGPDSFRGDESTFTWVDGFSAGMELGTCTYNNLAIRSMMHYNIFSSLCITTYVAFCDVSTAFWSVNWGKPFWLLCKAFVM